MGAKVKVVFDTNVWVSIFLKKALGEEFSEILRKETMEICVSEQILKEISKVLVYPKINELLALSGISMREILQTILRNSTIVSPKFELNVIKEDLDDNRILDCALQAKADFIVSGDKHLLKLRRFQNIKIITPREFLDTAERSQEK